jgi:hypothetical protein
MAGSDRCATHLSLAGRETKLTPELQASIVQLVRAGSYLPVACAAVGIARSTFYEWWNRGDPAGSERADAPHRVFRAELERARAEGEALLVGKVVTEARAGTWQAATWLLERMFPERWARASQREGPTPELEEKASVFDPFAEIDQLADARRKKLSRGGR